MDVIRRIPYSDEIVDTLRRCEEWLPKSLTTRAVLVGVVVGGVVYIVTKKRYNMPPGPRGWPLLGNMLEFRNATIYEKLCEWKEKYGPVITFKVGPQTMVALSNKDVVLEALVKQQADFAGRPQSYTSNLMSDGGKSIVLGSYNPTWKLHRKIATQALKYYMTGTKLEIAIEDSLTMCIESINKQDGKPFNPHAIMSNTVFNIINNICFATTCNTEDEYFKAMVRSLDAFVTEFGNGFLEDIIPPLRLFPTKRFRLLLSCMSEFFDMLTKQIDSARHTFDKENLRHLCDMIILAQEEAKAEEDPELMSQLTDRHVMFTMSDIFGAGMDTSRFTLLWSLYYLSIHKDVQEKLQNEVDNALGGRQFPRLSDKPNLHYTDAVLHEIMRMSTVAPLGVPHMTLRDSKIGKYEIPKDTPVFINHYALHYDPDEWRNPEVFDPERFLDAKGKMGPKPDSWLPFSAGRRVCLGESVAKPELLLLLAGIFRNFSVSFPPGVKCETDTSGGSFANTPKPFEVIMKFRL